MGGSYQVCVIQSNISGEIGNRPLKPKRDTCGKPHKTEDCWNGANAAVDPRPKRHNAAPPKADKTTNITTTEEAKNSKCHDYDSGTM